jgi:hypothetical protein
LHGPECSLLGSLVCPNCTTSSSTHDGTNTNHHCLLGLSLLNQLLLIRWQTANDILVDIVTDCFLVVHLCLLLRKHTPIHNTRQNVDDIFNLIWNVNEALQNANDPLCDANGPENAIIASCIHAVEAGLDEEARARNCTSCAAASLDPNTIFVLWLAKRATWEDTAATHIWLTDEFEQLKSLTSCHAAHATTSLTPK